MLLQLAVIQILCSNEYIYAGDPTNTKKRILGRSFIINLKKVSKDKKFKVQRTQTRFVNVWETWSMQSPGACLSIMEIIYNEINFLLSRLIYVWDGGFKLIV